MKENKANKIVLANGTNRKRKMKHKSLAFDETKGEKEFVFVFV